MSDIRVVVDVPGYPPSHLPNSKSLRTVETVL